MKHISISIIVIALILFTSSCTKDHVVTTCYIITNNSEHSVKINAYHKHQVTDSILLLKSKSEEFCFYENFITPPPWNNRDSVVVTFNDTISITHPIVYTEGEQVPQRILLFKEAWSGGQVKEREYLYKYIFTEADYQEALEYHNTNRNL